ncbi:MAG: hypothetical protein NVSMB68_01230 [Thermoanaerobaculia bacterium]
MGVGQIGIDDGVRRRAAHRRRMESDGPFFNYSNTWQLVINTGTTIVTFLMVFLIQRAQNKVPGRAVEAE